MAYKHVYVVVPVRIEDDEAEIDLADSGEPGPWGDAYTEEDDWFFASADDTALAWDAVTWALGEHALKRRAGRR